MEITNKPLSPAEQKAEDFKALGSMLKDVPTQEKLVLLASPGWWKRLKKYTRDGEKNFSRIGRKIYYAHVEIMEDKKKV